MNTAPLDIWLKDRMGLVDVEHVPTREQLRQWQLERLVDVVEHARKHSPFYADHLGNIDPSSISSFEDFAQIPCLTQDILRNEPERLLCVPQESAGSLVTLSSSGTTGMPKHTFHTAEDMQATIDYFTWTMSRLVAEGEVAFVLMPEDGPSNVGRLLKEALARFGAQVVTHGILEDVDAAIDHCLETKATCIVGPPAHLNVMSMGWEQRGLIPHHINSVLLCWDTVPGPVVHRVERVLGCSVYRHWGMVETGLGGAVECEPHSGMHLRETDVFVEIVRVGTCTPCPDGEFGEIVITTPMRRGMPLIRYRTGDMGRIIPGECFCGSPLRRLDTQIRRMTDTVDLAGVNLSLFDLNEALYAVEGLADFSVEYSRNTLRIFACGLGHDLSEYIRNALLRETQVGKAHAEGAVNLEIVVRQGCATVGEGLGKRRIRTE